MRERVGILGIVLREKGIGGENDAVARVNL
jgi:hypothetical protein